MIKTVLIIEDEITLRKMIAENLKLEKYRPLEAENGEEGLSIAFKEKPDLILLDVKLPKMNGYQVCEEIRKVDPWTPILMVTVKSDETDKVSGLKSGADDYITKPFSMPELLARIEALLRRSSLHENQVLPGEYCFENIHIFFDKLQIKKGNKIFDLTRREMEVLEFLIRHKGDVVTRDELLEQVWGLSGTVTTRTIDNHILHLRKILEKDPSHPLIIISHRHVGYQFTA